MRIFLVFIFTCVFYQITFAQAPYIINENYNQSYGGDNNGMGSSFLTSFSGQLDSIDVYIRTGSSATGSLKIFTGNSNNPSDLIYTQSLTGIPTGTFATYTIRLTSPVLLNANSTYTFMFYDSPIRFGYVDTYADGTMWTGAGFLSAGEHASYDVDFIAYIGVANVTDTKNSLANTGKYLSYTDHVIITNNFTADEIVVSDMEGKIAAQGQGKILRLNQNLRSGIYVVRARREQEIITQKIFIP